MSKTERFFELKELWKKSDESARAGIEKEIAALLSSMDTADDAELLEGVESDFRNIHSELENVRIKVLRNKLETILPAISVAYISKHYFGKSTSWFYQRLNGNSVNGKEASFTPVEINTLSVALKDLSAKINAVSMQL